MLAQQAATQREMEARLQAQNEAHRQELHTLSQRMMQDVASYFGRTQIPGAVIPPIPPSFFALVPPAGPLMALGTPVMWGYKPLYSHGPIWTAPSEVARPTG